MRYDFIKTVSEKGELIHKRTTKPLFEKIGAESINISGEVNAGSVTAGSLIAEDAQGAAFADNLGLRNVGGAIETELDDDQGSLAPLHEADLSGDIDLFIIAGQSNALGFGGDQSNAPSVSPGFAFQYEASSDSLIDFANNSNANVMGAAWPAFANELHAKTDRDICVVQTAVGGTSITTEADDGSGNWSESGSLFDDSVSDAQAAISHLEGQGYVPRLAGVLWSQGEEDATNLSNSEEVRKLYPPALKSVVSRYRDEFNDKDLTFTIAPTHARYGGPFQAVSNAQMQVASSYPNVNVADITRTFVYRELMANDGIHYIQQGLNEMGTEMAVVQSHADLRNVVSRVGLIRNADFNSRIGASRELGIDTKRRIVKWYDGRTQGGVPLSGASRGYVGSITSVDGSNNKIPLSTDSGDDGLGAIESGHIVVPADGWYELSMNLKASIDTAGTMDAWFYDGTDGAVLARTTKTFDGTNKDSINFQTEEYLQEDHTIEVFATQGTGSSAQVDGGRVRSFVTFSPS